MKLLDIMKNTTRPLPNKIKRIVVKVGSQLLVSNGKLHLPFILSLVKQIRDLRDKGIECVLVSSGAIGCGRASLIHASRNLNLPEKQAAAAIGQSRLMHTYNKIFDQQHVTTAQILLTKEDLDDDKRRSNANQTLKCLLKHKVTPIINENDTVSVDEIKFGDNDILASLIGKLIKADLLVILSSTNGLFDQTNLRVSKAKISDQAIWKCVRPDKTALGTGGMQSKLIAAKTMSEVKKPTIVADGKVANVLLKIMEGQDIGTLFMCASKKS
jgi:glutamate 5-kinase